MVAAPAACEAELPGRQHITGPIMEGIRVDKYELVERYEALGEEDDFLAAKRLFERDFTGQSGALDHRQYGYLLECHGRRALRRAVDQYEQAMALDPGSDKAEYQWMTAKAALGEQDDTITRYRDLVASPLGNARELRFLASAYLLARDFAAAGDVIDAGLVLVPGDWKLIADRGEVKASLGDPEGALADWRRALELSPQGELSMVYSAAFLLEREGRPAEAAESWRHIVEYCDAHGWELTAAWPRQELERLREQLRQQQEPPGS
jgi:tetratricopeptide (TPR) repeat protein